MMDSSEDDGDDDVMEGDSALYDDDSPELSPFVPTSPGELFLAFIFVFPSIVFIMYLVSFFIFYFLHLYAEDVRNPDYR